MPSKFRREKLYFKLHCKCLERENRKAYFISMTARHFECSCYTESIFNLSQQFNKFSR